MICYLSDTPTLKGVLHMLKRITLMLAMLGLMLSALAACGSTQQNGNSNGVTITFMTFDAVPDHLKDLDTIRRAFEAANPRIHVQVLPVAFDQYFTKLQVAVPGGSAPDPFQLDYQDFLSYASKGTLLDLSKAAPKGDYAGVYNSRAPKPFGTTGIQSGLPESFSDVLLFYNKDLFDKAH